MFTCSDKIKVFSFYFIHHCIHFSKTHNACNNVASNHKRWDTIGKSTVNHKVSCVRNYCRMKSCDITHKVVRTESYGLVTYTVMDSSGNPAQMQRKIPYYDPLPPEILLEEGGHITIPVGTVFEDPGFTATDNVDGDVTQFVEVSGEVVWYLPGTYELVYTVTDKHENNATVVRRVEVEAQPRPEIVIPDKKVVYLTFDDGPGPYTDLLLDVLAKYQVKATFFVIDSGYDKVMKRIVDEGHSIGIHSVTHDYQEIYASPEAYFADLRGMQDIIYENTGIRTTLMRFPGGSSNTVSYFNRGIMTTLTEAVQDAGFQYFDWNVDSNDAGGTTTADGIYENITNGCSGMDVSVVLCHDIKPNTAESARRIARYAEEQGYMLLTIDELFAKDGVPLTSGTVYYRCAGGDYSKRSDP